MAYPHIENQADYEQFVAAFNRFMESEGINNLSSDSDDEGGFSWRKCDCCNRSLGGARYSATGVNPATKEVNSYSICGDCVYFAEYGRLDDSTMLDYDLDPNF